MTRELNRTLISLSAPYQENISNQQIELIVVDNGSSEPIKTPENIKVKVLKVEKPTHSPVPAVNLGLNAATGNLIGVMIDGARMVSPGLLSNAIKAAKISEKPIISTLGFHLGSAPQQKSVKNGYNQAKEDKLLDSIQWQHNGYALFSISVFALSNATGWFMPHAESTAIFMFKNTWQELQGYDEGFKTPGGGLANLDLLNRAMELPDSENIILLGEGTFHQVHGGVSTNQNDPVIMQSFFDEYIQIRGKPFVTISKKPIFLGHFSKYHLDSLKISVDKLFLLDIDNVNSNNPVRFTPTQNFSRQILSVFQFIIRKLSL